ncbi:MULTISPECIES: cysteine hydrolase family protein [Mesorhizobium]|uniref:Hydrolase n=1 Tax=Rhizobium loti TaxID=381 RepID=A0A6M7TX29_RHILI|nr:MULTISPECIES: isochorismatase family protein [Mesorhizobium]OBQ70848.1 hydrolase [Mesorhizobium loti]QKC69651.1 isochorismatase family protein [Mesorhizobium loti]QKC88941.1 isochorismatase family protein [Mesorhizobium sp. NZP2234]
MAVTTLDPKTALIVIDLQKGIVSLPCAHPIGDVVQRAGALADAFRGRALPVVLVNVAGAPSGRTEQAPRVREFPAGWTDLVPELKQQRWDHIVTKRTVDAFVNTGLEAWLKGEGVTQVVISGVSTSMGVEATARHARDLGFNVTLAIDAMTDMNLDAHTNSIGHIFPRLGENGTTRDILDLLDKGGA